VSGKAVGGLINEINSKQNKAIECKPQKFAVLLNLK
jgi:hypothetical protein